MEEQGGGEPQGGRETINSAEHTTPVDSPKVQGAVPQFDTVNGSYHFTLTGYSLARGRGPGKYIASGNFTVGGHEWAIYFYPDGACEDHSSYVSVFIALVSDSSDVQALFELTLLDRSGKGRHKTHSHFDRQIEWPYTLKYQGSKWGYKRFFRREALEQSHFLKDDTLEFRGRVGVLLSSIKATKLYSRPTSPLSPQDVMHHPQSSGEEDSSPQKGINLDGSPDSQSDDAFVKKLEGLRIQDELARYFHRLNSSQNPGNFHERSDTRQASTN